MKKFMLGLLCGGVLVAAGSAAYASEALQSIQAYLFPVKFVINGQNKQPDGEYATLNYNGHVYVPVRFVAEAMGGVVGYEEESGTVHIHSPDLASLRTKLDVGLNEREAVALLGDRYKEVVYPNGGDGKVWRYDLGVQDGYRVQAVWQNIETWADPEGLRNGRIRLQVLLVWVEGKVDQYYFAYAGPSGEVRYETGEAQLEWARDRLIAEYAALESQYKVKLMYAGIADKQLEFVFRGRDDFERRWSDRELNALRRSVYEAAGLNALWPFPLRFEQFVLDKRADISGVITEIDKENARILIVGEAIAAAPGDDRPDAVWVKLNEDGKVVRTTGAEPAAWDDLVVGQRIGAWFDGEIVLLSYPAQTKALLIRVE